MATYLEVANLKEDPDFRKRVAVAILRYAAYVMGSSPTEEFREYRINWARRALVSTDEQVYRIMGFVVSDANVQTELAAISDAALQAAVEYHIQQNMAVLV